MNPLDQPTPRTDAMLNGCEWGNRQDQAYTALCRTLERELTDEREKVRVLREALESLAYWSRNKIETRITLRNRIATALATTEEKP
jgi:hypothetical protein